MQLLIVSFLKCFKQQKVHGCRDNRWGLEVTTASYFVNLVLYTNLRKVCSTCGHLV